MCLFSFPPLDCEDQILVLTQEGWLRETLPGLCLHIWEMGGCTLLHRVIDSIADTWPAKARVTPGKPPVILHS